MFILPIEEDEEPRGCPHTKVFIDSRDPAYDEKHHYVSGKCVKCGLLQYDPSEYFDD